MKAKALMVSLALAACAGTPGPGEPGYSYNLDGEYAAEIEADDGSVFSGTIQLETLLGGELTGTMSLTSPMSVSGDISGLLIGAEASLEMTYAIADLGCGGAAAGTAIIDEGGSGASGTLEVTLDECGGGPTSLAMTLTRN